MKSTKAKSAALAVHEDLNPIRTVAEHEAIALQREEEARALSALNNPPPPSNQETENSVSQPFEKSVTQTPENSVNHTALIVPLRHVRPTPLNARSRFDPDRLLELADSIKAHGVLEPLVVREADYWLIDPDRRVERWYIKDRRRIRNDGYEMAGFNHGPLNGINEVYDSLAAAEDHLPQYELIAGERRFRAAILAGLEDVPVNNLGVVSDLQAAELGMVENLQRQDIDPIDTARGYQALSKLGMPQREIAGKVHRSQSLVANILRLLQLPDDVQQMIQEGDLSMSHGIALCRQADFPDVVRALAKLAVENSLSSKALDEKLPRAYELQQRRVVRELGYHTAFDYKLLCDPCPFNARVLPGENHNMAYCLKPSHYDMLDAAARVEQEKAAAETIERARASGNAKVQQRLTQITEQHAARGTDQPAEEAAEAPAMLTYRDFDGVPHMEIGGRIPEGCGPDCTCRVTIRGYGDRLTDICVDPGRLNSLKAAESRKIKAAVRTANEEILEQLTAALPLDPSSVALAIPAWSYLYSIPVEIRRAVAVRVTGPARETLQSVPHGIKREDAWSGLATLTPAMLISVLLECECRLEMAEGLENARELHQKTDWFLAALTPSPTGAPPTDPRQLSIFDTPEPEPQAATEPEAVPEPTPEPSPATQQARCHCGALATWEFAGQPLCNHHHRDAFPWEEAESPEKPAAETTFEPGQTVRIVDGPHEHLIGCAVKILNVRKTAWGNFVELHMGAGKTSVVAFEDVELVNIEPDSEETFTLTCRKCGISGTWPLLGRSCDWPEEDQCPNCGTEDTEELKTMLRPDELAAVATPQPTALRVGDQVRIINHLPPRNGLTGSITAFGSAGGLDLVKIDTGGGSTLEVGTQCVEKIADAPELPPLRVGEQVRATGAGWGASGTLVTVREVTDRDDGITWASVEYQPGKTAMVPVNQLERLPNSTPRPSGPEGSFRLAITNADGETRSLIMVQPPADPAVVDMSHDLAVDHPAAGFDTPGGGPKADRVEFECSECGGTSNPNDPSSDAGDWPTESLCPMCDSLKVGQFVDTTSPGFAPGVSVNIVKGRLAGESGTVVKLSGSGSRCHLTLNPGGQEVLLPVTSLDVASPEPVPAVSGRPFMKGEMVRVVSGHFEGLSGTIAAIDIPGVLYQVDLPGYSAPALVGHGKLQSAESEALSA